MIAMSRVDSIGLWVAFGLAVLNAAVWALVVVKCKQLWRQYAPMVMPLLASMFGGGHGAQGDPATLGQAQGEAPASGGMKHSPPND